MEIREILRKDHREAMDLMETICKESGDTVKELFKEAYTAILAHAHAEQKVLYTFLKDHGDEELRKLALEAEVEHKLVEELLEMLKSSTAKGSEKWMARCKVLKEMLEHHIEEEEGDMFSLMDSVLEQRDLENLGMQMEKKEEEEKRMAA